MEYLAIISLGVHMNSVSLVLVTQTTNQAESPPQINPLLFVLVFFICVAASFLLCRIAKGLFPKYRSGEHKPGTHRADLPAGGREIKTIELPLVGGPAFILALLGTGVAAGFIFSLDYDQWVLLLISLGATFGYALVGFIDDWFKVYRNSGISEKTKFTGIFLVGAVAAILYFFLLPESGQQPYSIWKDLPILNTLFCAHSNLTTPNVCSIGTPLSVSYFSWLIFLTFLTGMVGSATSICVDFSDGLDGLAGGLVFSTSLAMGIVVAGLVGKQPFGIVLEVLALLGAGSVLGYLPWNWPSAWAARRGKAKRRARIYMGDCGALGLGGMLAMTAVFSRNELLLFMVGGAFVLEGLSAVISARFLTPFFRSRLQSLRFANNHDYIPHTEFPLPFLATPLHHHFDLLGWDRRRLVYGSWALGASFAALGVMASLDPIGWQRWMARFLCLILAVAIWSSGSWSKSYFVGKHPAERSRRRRLALYYGYPFRILRLQLFHLVEIIDASEDVIETPAEELTLWHRMSIFDARSMLGLYCYRAGYYPAALAQWTRIPERNRALRPEIARLLAEIDNRLALETQETQPMRRDQILPQEPILEGNLAPADLPNPYEPIRQEEKGGQQLASWNTADAKADEDQQEEKVQTAPLRSIRLNGNATKDSTSDLSRTSLALGTNQATGTPPQANWLVRLLGFGD
jgi:UDP-N-acetylmuramyl pentapeptide phosphotransferase/UDP-N-acetylglucosamine-1-phosphate transferase